MLQDLSRDELTELHDATWDMAGPQLLVVMEESTVIQCLVVADDCKLECPAMTFRQALFILISIYYIAWLSYPSAFNQIVGFLQEYVLGELFATNRAKSCVQLMHKLEKIITKKCHACSLTLMQDALIYIGHNY